MNRRASLPGADELFRSTQARADQTSERGRGARGGRAQERSPGAGRGTLAGRGGGERGEPEEDAAPEASGRVRHDQKITVYLTGQELLDLEQARLRLRAEFDIAVDRGRIVREAVAELLQDLHDEGPDAAIVRRLS